MSNSKVRMAAIAILLMLALQSFSQIPLAPTYAVQPQPATQPVSATKTYTANKLGTQVQTTITLSAELNGTITFSLNNVEAFRIFVPSGLIGITSLLSNGTHAIVDVRGGLFFIQEKWKLDAQNFKMELCWNLAAPTTVRLPLSRVDSFAGNAFAISKLRFDWNDAIKAGYSIGYENSTRSIAVNVQTSGCLDPIITTSQTNSQLFQQSERVRYSAGRWYALACEAENNGPARVRSSGDGGGTWNSGNTVTGHTTTGEDCGTNHSFYLDGSHIFYTYARCCAGQKDAWFRRINYTSSGVLTNETTVLVDTSTTDCNGDGLFYPTVTINSTGYPFLFATRITDTSPCSQGAANISYGALFMPSDIKGTSWTRYDFQIQATDWSVVIISKILDGGSGRLRIAFNNGTSIYTRTWHQGNRSFGSVVAIPSSTTGLNTNNWDCEATSDFVLHCLYQRSNVLYYRNVTLSGTLGTEVTMSSSITGNFYPTVSKGSNNNTIFLATLFDGIDKISWNRSSTNLAWVERSTTDVASTAVELAVSSISQNPPSDWGYYVTTGSVAPYDITFSILLSSEDILVAGSAEWDREPHLVSSLNTNALVASYIRGNETSGHVSSCGISNSVDGGRKWNASTALLGGIFPSTNQTHAAIAVDLNNVFYAICSQNATRTQQTSTIFYRSFDEGIRWKILPTTIAQANIPNTLDKPWILADTWSTSDYKNSIYACWSRFNSTNSEILFRKIAPSASAEKVLYRISRTDANVLLTGCNMAIGPKGEVYVAWIHLLTSTDASIEFRWNELGEIDWGWGRVHNVTTLKRFPTTGCPTNSRGLGCLTGSGGSLFNVANDPSIATDMLGGVHIVFANYSSTAGGEIRYVNSGDCKRDSVVDVCSWTSPVTINIDNSNRDQWEPAIHVSSRTNSTNPRGIIHVTVLDRRDDSSNIKWRVYDYYCLPATLSTCTSASNWTNIAVSDVQIDNAGKDRIGEYHGTTNTQSKDMYAAWTDSRNFPGNGYDVYADWLFK